MTVTQGEGATMDAPYLKIEDSGDVFELRGDVTTVGRGEGVDVRLTDPSVSRLHAELIRRGPFIYLSQRWGMRG